MMADSETVGTPCAVCGTTFGEVLDGPQDSGDWTFHWGGPNGTVVVAETCSEACAAEYEKRGRT